MKICFIYQDQYPWDIRIDKMVNSLENNGHEVHLISRNKTGLPVDEKISENMFIHRLPKGFGKYIRYLLNFPAFFSPFWVLKIYFIVKKFNCRLIIVRDLPLGPTAVAIGRLLDIPVIMDMAENYPAMIQDTWKFRGSKLIDYFIRNPFLLRKLERWLAPKLDGFFVVSPASKKRLESLLKDCKKPIWVIGNTPRLDVIGDLRRHPLVDRMNEYPGMVLLYTGGLEESRGLDIVIESVPILLNHDIEVLVVIVGSGSGERKLKSLCGHLKVEDHVLLTGWIDPVYIPSIINAADICIVPHYVTGHTETTIPNKIYDYMAQKKPVIVTQAASLKEIVETVGCGRVYHDSDPDDLSKAILELQNKKLQKELGESGFLAVKERFNWSIDEKILLEAIRHYQ